MFTHRYSLGIGSWELRIDDSTLVIVHALGEVIVPREQIRSAGIIKHPSLGLGNEGVIDVHGEELVIPAGTHRLLITYQDRSGHLKETEFAFASDDADALGIVQAVLESDGVEFVGLGQLLAVRGALGRTGRDMALGFVLFLVVAVAIVVGVTQGWL